jgi:hypothetical protein
LPPAATPAPAGEQPDAAEPLPSPQPPTSRLELNGVPIFPDTPAGRNERSAYYEARKLNHLPHSLLDHNDAKRDIEPPAGRRAREQLTDRSR